MQPATRLRSLDGSTLTEMKEVRSVMDAIMTKIPGYSTQVPPKRDLFGERKLMPWSYP